MFRKNKNNQDNAFDLALRRALTGITEQPESPHLNSSIHAVLSNPRVNQMPALQRSMPLPAIRLFGRTISAMAATALVALLASPVTRPLVVAQICLLVPSASAIARVSPEGYLDPRVDNLVASKIREVGIRLQNDEDAQIAMAMKMPVHDVLTGRQRNARFRSLMLRFPNSAKVCAAALRSMATGSVRITRTDLEERYGGMPKPVQHSDAGDVEEYIAVSQMGCRLEPQNALFPSLLAVGLIEAKRDTEAFAALHRAAKCSKWDDYYDSEMHGMVKLQTQAFGYCSASTQIGFASSLLLPHYSSIRAFARAAAYSATIKEQDGQVDQGLQIRRDLLELGASMRRNCRTAIGNLVGIAVSAVSTSVPVHGIGQLDALNKHGQDYPLRRFTLYTSLLNRSAAVEPFRAEWEKGKKAKGILETGFSLSPFADGAISTYQVASIVNMMPLCSIVWLIFAGICASGLSGINGSRTLSRITPIARRRLMASVSFITVSGTFVALSAYTTQVMEVFVRALSQITALTDGPTHPVIMWRLPLTAVVPCLVIYLLASLAIVQRKPIISSVVQGLRGKVVPLAALIFLTYTATVPFTLATENALKMSLTGNVRHEGQTAAHLLHTRWPD